MRLFDNATASTSTVAAIAQQRVGPISRGQLDFSHTVSTTFHWRGTASRVGSRLHRARASDCRRSIYTPLGGSITTRSRGTAMLEDRRKHCMPAYGANERHPRARRNWALAPGQTKWRRDFSRRHRPWGRTCDQNFAVMPAYTVFSVQLLVLTTTPFWMMLHTPNTALWSRPNLFCQ